MLIVSTLSEKISLGSANSEIVTRRPCLKYRHPLGKSLITSGKNLRTLSSANISKRKTDGKEIDENKNRGKEEC